MELKVSPAPSSNNKIYVYQTIKSNIMELRLQPGQSVNETEIGKILNVSRTPVREAFIRLIEDHLIVTYPQRGSYICKIDMTLVHEGSFMRRCLEKAVYTEAAEQSSPELIQSLKRNLAVQKAVVQTAGDASGDFESEFMKLDDEFHQLIFKFTDKSNIWQSINSLNTHYNRLRFLELKEQTNIYKVLFQHEMLIHTFENKSFHEVPALVDEHLTNVMDIMPSIRKKYESYFI